MSNVAKVVGGVMHYVSCNPVRVDIVPVQPHSQVPLVGGELGQAFPQSGRLTLNTCHCHCNLDTAWFGVER